MRKVLRGYAKDKDGTLIVMGTIAVRETTFGKTRRNDL